MQVAGKELPFMVGFPHMDGNVLKKWFKEVAQLDPSAPIGYMAIVAELVGTTRHDEPQNTADVLIKYHITQVTSVIVHPDGMELVIAIYGQAAIVYVDNTYPELVELITMIEENPASIPTAKSDRLFIYSFPGLLAVHLAEEADRNKNAGSPTPDHSDR